MTETLTCYPSGCAGCRHRTDGGCELMALLGGHDAVEINRGGSARAQHPIDGRQAGDEPRSPWSA